MGRDEGEGQVVVSGVLCVVYGLSLWLVVVVVDVVVCGCGCLLFFLTQYAEAQVWVEHTPDRAKSTLLCSKLTQKT